MVPSDYLCACSLSVSLSVSAIRSSLLSALPSARTPNAHAQRPRLTYTDLSHALVNKEKTCIATVLQLYMCVYSALS